MIFHRMQRWLSVATLFCTTMVIGCGGSASIANLSASELFTIAVEKYEKKKFLSAIEHFQTVIFSHPGAAVVDSAQYYLGLSYFGNEDYALSGIEFNRLLLNYPSSPYAANAQFMKAVSFFEGTPSDFSKDQSDLNQAIKQLEDFIVDNPESEMVADSRQYIALARGRIARKYYESGVVYTRMGSFPSAKIYYQQVVDEYTDTEFAAKASYQIAESEMKMRNYDEARRQYANFTVVFAEHEWVPMALKYEMKAAFKSGEVLFKKGNYDESREKFRFFIQNYSTSDKIKKAHEYLKKIEAVSPSPPSQAKKDES